MKAQIRAWTTLIETRWQALPWAIRWSTFIIVSVLILFARSPGILLNAEFANEDGQTFFLGTYFGSPLEVVFRPYAGYLHLVPRLAAYGERAVPIAWAPFVANLTSLLIIAAVAAFIASDRLAGVAPRRGFRWLLALTLLLLPAEWEIVGTITNTTWLLGLFLAGVLLAGPARSRLEALATRASLVLASLSGPFGLLFSPLFVLRAVRDRTRDAVWSAVCVVVPGLLQMVALAKTASDRPTPLGEAYSVVNLLGAFLARVVTEPILGARWTTVCEAICRIMLSTSAWVVIAMTAAWLIIVVAILATLIRGLSKHVSRWTIFVIAYVSVIVMALGVFVNPLQSELSNPYLSQRYFLFAGFAVAIIILGGAFSLPKSQRLLKYSVLVLLAIGIVSDFSLREHPKYDWPATSACIGGPVPCIVPVFAAPDWSIRWPGVGGTYSQTPPWPPSQYASPSANSPSPSPSL